jgi:hypothetical protein
MGISLKTRKMLWGRSGNRCALPSCRKELLEDETETDDASIVGDEAHIVAREEDGPRGKSELTPEQRDKYTNLILMCKNHHKMIDDQPLKFTVQALIKMKQDHIAWITKNLSPDSEKQKDDEQYASYVDKWVELGDIQNWQVWTSDLLSCGQPSIWKNKFENLKNLNSYLFARIWSKRQPDLEYAFKNFRIILNDLIKVFDKYKETTGEDDDVTLVTREIYKTERYLSDADYQEASERFDFQVDLVQDLTLELTRAANYLCDQIRIFLIPSFRIEEGALLIEYGPNTNLEWITVRAEYKDNNKETTKYPGLREFMVKRSGRGHSFGNGVREEYFLK